MATPGPSDLKRVRFRSPLIHLSVQPDPRSPTEPDAPAEADDEDDTPFGRMLAQQKMEARKARYYKVHKSKKPDVEEGAPIDGVATETEDGGRESSTTVSTRLYRITCSPVLSKGFPSAVVQLPEPACLPGPTNFLAPDGGPASTSPEQELADFKKFVNDFAMKQIEQDHRKALE